MGEGTDQQRVAVGRRLGDRIVADRAAGARPVVDHDGLAERLLQLGRDQPRRGVGAAARRIGNDYAYGLRGELLRQGRRGEARGRRTNQNTTPTHQFLHPIHSHTPRPMTHSRSSPFSHGISSVNMVTPWR